MVGKGNEAQAKNAAGYFRDRVSFHFFSKWEGVFLRLRYYFSRKTGSTYYSSNKLSLPIDIEGQFSVQFEFR
jgi:hypothetical protein